MAKKKKTSGFNLAGGSNSKKNSFNLIPNESVAWRLKTTDGKDFGNVSYGAYKAVENGTLDSYTPKNNSEQKILDNYKKYINSASKTNTSNKLILTDYIPKGTAESKERYNRRRATTPSLPEFGSYEYFKDREEKLRPYMVEISKDPDRTDDTYKAWAENYEKDNNWTDKKGLLKQSKELYYKFKAQNDIIEQYNDVNAQLERFENKDIHFDSSGEVDTKSGKAEAEYAGKRQETIVDATTFTNNEMILGHLGKLDNERQRTYDNIRVDSAKRNVSGEKVKAYDYYEKNKDKQYDDNLAGRFSGSAKVGRIRSKADNADYTSLVASTDDTIATQIYERLSVRIQENNKKTFINNTKAEEFVSLIGGYVPQAFDQITERVKGEVIGAAMGYFSAGPAGVAFGRNLGGSASVANYMYKQTAGAAYGRALRESGLSIEDAKKIASDEALASSAVEFGLEFGAGLLWKGIGKAKSLVKGTAKEVVKDEIANMSSKLTNKLIAKGISEKGANIIVNTAKNIGKLTIGAFGEGAEEWIQSGISITADRYAKEGKATSPFKLFINSFDLSKYSDEDLKQMNQDFLAGTVLGFVSSGTRAGTSYATNKTISSVANAVDNKKLGSEILNSNTDAVKNIIALGKSSKSQKTVKLATDIKNALNNDKKTVSTLQVGKLTKNVFSEMSELTTDNQGHTPEQIQIIKQYEASVDNDLLDFIDYAKNNTKDNSKVYSISDVSTKASENIKSLTGIDTTGWEHTIKTNSVRHIEARHGENGTSDHSMTDEDIARIAYVLENYDTVEAVDDVSKEYRDKNQHPAPLIRFSKRIDGTYYVVEAVPDTQKHQLPVVAAYKNKAEQQTRDVQAPTRNVRNASADAFDNPIVSQDTEVVNTNIRNNSENDTRNYLLTNEQRHDILTNNRYGLVDDVFSGQLTTDEKNALDVFGKAVGVPIKIVPTLNNGRYNGKYDGIIYVALDCDNKVMAVFSHEVTHHFENASPNAYSHYQKAVFDILEQEKGVSIGELIRVTINSHAQMGEILSFADAKHEIVADYTEKFLSSPQEFMTALDKVQSINDKQKMNILQRLIASIKNIIGKFTGKRNVPSEISATERAVNSLIDMIREAKFNYGMVSENIKAQYSAKEATNNGLETLTKKEWNDFYRSLGELERGMWFPKTINGDYIFEAGDKLLVNNGDYSEPRIYTIIEFEYLNANEIEFGKEVIYHAAQRTADSKEYCKAARDLLGKGNVTSTSTYSSETDRNSQNNTRKRGNGTKDNGTTGEQYSVKGVLSIEEALKAETAKDKLPQTDKYTNVNNLTSGEWSEFYRSLGELERGMWFPKTSDGYYIFEIDDKLIFNNGSFSKPDVHRIVSLSFLNEEDIEYGKEFIWNVAERGANCEECCEIVRDMFREKYDTSTSNGTDTTDLESSYDTRERSNGTKDNGTTGEQYSVKGVLSIEDALKQHSTVSENVKAQYLAKDNSKQLMLPKAEYAMVASAITKKNARYADTELQAVDYVFAADNFYVYENISDSEFKVVSKYDIETDYEQISYVTEAIKNGDYRIGQSFNRWYASFRSGKGSTAGNTRRVENTERQRKDDGVPNGQLREQSTDGNTVRHSDETGGDTQSDNSTNEQYSVKGVLSIEDALKAETANAKAQYLAKDNSKQLMLPKAEYAMVASAITKKNARYADTQLQTVDYVFAADNFYVYENVSDGGFKIVSKIDIETESERIDTLMGVVNNGIYSNTDRDRLNRLLADVRSGKRSNNRNNGRLENRTTAVANDRVYSSQSGSNTVRNSEQVGRDTQSDNAEQYSVKGVLSIEDALKAETANAKAQYSAKDNFDEIYIEPREYIQLREYIIHKNNSNSELKTLDWKEIGNNFYIWNNNSKTDFKVVEKIEIEGNEDFIDDVRSGLDGIDKGTESISHILEILDKGYGSGSDSVTSDKDIRARGDDVSIYESKSSSNGRGNSGESIRNKATDNSTNEQHSVKGVLSIEDALKQYGAISQGEIPARDVAVPKKISDTRPVSQFARTMMEAGITPDSAVSEFEERIMDGTMTHEVITNKNAEVSAKKTIKELGFEGALNRWNELAASGKIGKKELALGMELYNQCITSKDVHNAMKLAADLTAEATSAGQVLQATQMLKRMSPDGQLYYIEKSVRKMNDEFTMKFGDKFKDIIPDEGLFEEYLNAPNDEARNAAYDRICQNIADQIPATMVDKWNSWRYLAMLGNPRTHIRNIVGNAVFLAPNAINRYTTVALERVIGIDASERTRSFKKSKESVEFAKKDFLEMQKVLQGENAKYATTGDIESRRTIFKTKWIEALRRKNFDFLEKEDLWFLKHHYVNTLAQLITVRRIDVNNISPAALDTIRAIAIREAQAATYRDANAVAEAIGKIERQMKNNENVFVRGMGVAVEGVMPFKKTPMNIVKQGINYSPISLLKGIYKGLHRLKNGDAYSATDVIGDFAKGLTGSGLMILGVFLADLGLLVGGEDEDKKKKSFDKMVGEQSYAIKMGDNTYTIDWMTPVCLPLFVGVELNKLRDDKFSFSESTKALSTLTEPLLELSVFSGIADAIASAKYSGSNEAVAMLTDIGLSYAMQAFPTVGGQASRIIDNNRRDYYFADKNSQIPYVIQRMAGQAASKVPFASYLFANSVDNWGRDMKYGGTVERVLENFVSPGYYSKTDYTDVDKELQRLYGKTGDNSVLPVTQQKFFVSDGVYYYMTSKQFAEVKRMRGQESFRAVQELINSGKYSLMSDDEKVKAISRCYENAGKYAKEQMLDEVMGN